MCIYIYIICFFHPGILAMYFVTPIRDWVCTAQNFVYYLDILVYPSILSWRYIFSNLTHDHPLSSISNPW